MFIKVYVNPWCMKGKIGCVMAGLSVTFIESLGCCFQGTNYPFLVDSSKIIGSRIGPLVVGIFMGMGSIQMPQRIPPGQHFWDPGQSKSCRHSHTIMGSSFVLREQWVEMDTVYARHEMF